MAEQMNVFPECNVDTNLVSHILGCYVKHKSTCNEVVKAINESDVFAIGIIDADKRKATVDSGFHEYELPLEVDGKSRHISLFMMIEKDTCLPSIRQWTVSFLMQQLIRMPI